MSECSISIYLSVDSTARATELITAFQQIYKIGQENVGDIKSILNRSFGEKFTEIIYSELSSKDDVLKYKKYLKEDLVKNIDHYNGWLNFWKTFAYFFTTATRYTKHLSC